MIASIFAFFGVNIFILNNEQHGGSVNSANSENLINHLSMNWAQFKNPGAHMCRAGAVVISRSLTKDDVGSTPFTVNN